MQFERTTSSTWPSLPPERHLSVNLAEQRIEPHLLRLAFLETTPEMEAGPSSGSSAVVELEHRSASSNVEVTITSSNDGVRLMPLGTGWTYRDDGSVVNTIPNVRTISFRVTAFDTGEPGEPANVIELTTLSGEASIQTRIESRSRTGTSNRGRSKAAICATRKISSARD